MLIDPAVPMNGIVNWSVFVPHQVVADGIMRARTWQKPPGASMLFILAVGPGGHGAPGTSGASGTARAGGGGGASGSVSRVLVPAAFLPDVLYIRVARGAITGDTTVTDTVVGVAPDFQTDQSLIIGAPGGGRATSATGASAGGILTRPFSSLGIIVNTTGQGGGGGGSTGNAVAVTPSTSLFVTGGAGGGAGPATAINSTGGSIAAANPSTGTALWGLLVGGQGSVENPGTNGAHGRNGLNHGVSIKEMLSRNMPLIFSGGSGGGSIGETTATGGRGGDGAWGCGGGGGGGGTAAGAGGRGGDGFVIIGAW